MASNPDDAVADSQEGGDVVKVSQSSVVTNDTFYDYFDNSGTLLPNVTSDELIFEGNFSNVGGNNLIINKPIKLTGNNATLNDFSIAISSSDVIVNGFNIVSRNVVTLINVENASNVEINDNNIDVVTKNDCDSYAIYAHLADNIKLINNTILYVGITTWDGDSYKNCVKISNSKNALIKDNSFDITVPSCVVGWLEIPPGSGNWEGFVITGGISIDSCDELKFKGNDIKLNYNDVVGLYDTIYVVEVRNSTNAVLSDNEIDANGCSYIYGIVISGENFIISDNVIKTSSDYYYANGIDIEGPASGVVENNNITCIAPTAIYPIYSAMSNGNVSVNYTGNNIAGEGYFVCGMEVAGTNEFISNNVIDVKGNYTIGIGSAANELVAEENVITLDASNIGYEYVWDDLGVETAGIKINKGNSLINANTIVSNAIGIKAKGNKTSIVENNITIANITGDGYAIYAYDVSSLNIEANEVNYVGSTEGLTINYALYALNCTNASICDNTFDISIPSCAVDWREIPPGSGNWVGVAVSEGIVIESCDGLKFIGNDIGLQYNDVVGYYDTIYVVDVSNSTNTVLSGNKIDAKGYTYIYGILISGDDFEISDNEIKTSSDDYHANGIDIEGPATGVVKNNNITCTAPTAVYPIYSAMSNGNISVNYTDNTIIGEGYFVCGMEVAGTNEIISGNVIDVKGNYTIGIGSAATELVAKDNVITLDASNIGDEVIWDDLGVETAGIKINKGNALINANTIVSNAIGIKAKGGNIDIVENDITVGNLTGDGYAIYAYNVSSLNIEGNDVNYVGSTEGLTINYALYALNCTNASICDNTFDISIPSCPVSWFEIPPGSGNWVGVLVSEGIVIESCDGLEFSGNDIDLQYNDVVGLYDTIYVVDVKNSTNAVLSDNEIDANGYSYIYGILISGDNFTISDNVITTTADGDYANGIDIEGPATGVVKDNIIHANASSTAYPIYSAMSNGNVSVNYTGNMIAGNAYFVCGMELAGIEAIVDDNVVMVSGNYTIGIGSVVDDLTISNNAITAVASNVGDEYIWDAIGVETAAIKVKMGNATINENNIYSNVVGAKLGGESIVLQENTIVVESNNSDSYAVYASDVDDLTIEGNTVSFVGSTDGYAINNALYAVNCSDAFIADNEFNIDIPSCAVTWIEVPPSSGNWISMAVSEGIVIDSCDDLEFSGNEIELNYNNVVGYYDTIYVVDVKNSTNAVLSENTIDANGYSYVYGIIISGDNFTISGNEITTSSDAYHANGIDIEGPAFGVVEGNVISTKAPYTSYPIYSAMSNGNVSVNYTDNELSGEGYFVCGMELAGVESNVENNKITATGNYTIGIGSVSEKLNVKDNTIEATGSNVGSEYIWDGIGVETMGIKVLSGTATIVSNDVVTTGDYSVGVNNTSSSVHDNHLLAKELFGDNSVNFTGDAEVYNNTPTNASQISAKDMKMYYGDSFPVLVTDENGNPIAKGAVKITVTGKTYTVVTDENGIAKLPIRLTPNTYDIAARYVGNDTFAPSTCENKITVLSSIKAETMARVYNTGMDFKATFLDTNGKALANTKVSFIVNDKEYFATTDSNGVAKLNAKLAPGSYRVTAVNPNTTQKFSKTANIVKRLQMNKDIKMDYYDGTSYSVKAFDDNGNPVGAGAKVKITVSGKTYVCQTNKYGYAILKINLPPNSYKITAEYKGYKVTNNIVVNQVLKASSVTKKKAKSYSFSATLKSSSGKAISGKTVSFTVNGKTYSATTNSNGIATVNINQALNAGKYTVLVKYIKTFVKPTLTIKN